MGDRSAELKELRERLDLLQKIETQEDFDEGARLHAEKNAPWVHGQYSDLKFEPYVFRAYPRMLYNLDYAPACLAYEQALIVPGRGSDEGVRQHAVTAALRRKTEATKIVPNAAEHAGAQTRNWYDSPDLAAAAAKAVEQERYVQQGHREYEDRNLGELAKAEATAYDDAAGDFTPIIPEQAVRRKPGPTPKKSEVTV